VKRQFKIKGIKDFSIEDGENQEPEYYLGIHDKLEEMDFDPVKRMIGWIEDPKTPMELKVQMACKIASLQYPAFVIHEHIGPNGDPI